MRDRYDDKKRGDKYGKESNSEVPNTGTGGEINCYGGGTDDKCASQIRLGQDRQQHAAGDKTKGHKSIMECRSFRVPPLKPNGKVKNKGNLRKLSWLKRGVKNGQPAFCKSIIFRSENEYNDQARNSQPKNIHGKLLPNTKVDLGNNEHRANTDKHTDEMALEEEVAVNGGVITAGIENAWCRNLNRFRHANTSNHNQPDHEQYARINKQLRIDLVLGVHVTGMVQWDAKAFKPIPRLSP